MATSVIMPRQGQSVESCILSTWHKKPGEPVKVGDMLFSYETDKASFDEEAKVDGILFGVLFEENDDVPCLMDVCQIGTAEEAAGYKAGGASTKAETAATDTKTSGEMNVSEEKSGVVENTVAAEVVSTTNIENLESEQPVAEDGQTAISPRARHLAQSAGVPISLAVPTGPNGRIIERDIMKLRDAGVRLTAAAGATLSQGGSVTTAEGSGLGGRISSADLAAAGTVAARDEKTGIASVSAVASGKEAPASLDLMASRDVPLPNIRKVIAKAMFQSISTSCQLTLNAFFDATTILSLRANYKKAVKPEIAGVTLTDMILFAVSKTLKNHPALNAHFLDTSMRYFDHVHLGLAVDTERGLMVPTLFGADTLSLSTLSQAAKAAAKECQGGSINPDKLKGGSFTVTNLGTFGISSFTPVLNTPQTGILGVNTLETKVREGKNGMETYQAMGLSLTFDHRAIDGAPAAKFLQELSANLEHFDLLLAL